MKESSEFESLASRWNWFQIYLKVCTFSLPDTPKVLDFCFHDVTEFKKLNLSFWWSLISLSISYLLVIYIWVKYLLKVVFTCVVASCWIAHCFPPSGDFQTQKNQLTFVEQVSVTVWPCLMIWPSGGFVPITWKRLRMI